MKLCCHSKNNAPSTAKVVDGSLILSLPDAVNPVVWRMELGHVKSLALEIGSSKDGNMHTLRVKTPKGEQHEIASFTQKSQAMDTLMAVSAALQSASAQNLPFLAQPYAGTAHPVSGSATPHKTMTATLLEPLKWIIAFALVIGVIMAFSYLGTISPQSGESTTATESSGNASSTNGQGDSGETGTPQSADQFLKGF